MSSHQQYPSYQRSQSHQHQQHSRDSRNFLYRASSASQHPLDHYYTSFVPNPQHQQHQPPSRNPMLPKTLSCNFQNDPILNYNLRPKSGKEWYNAEYHAAREDMNARENRRAYVAEAPPHQPGSRRKKQATINRDQLIKIEHNTFYNDHEAENHAQGGNGYESIDLDATLITGYEGKRRKLHPETIESLPEQYQKSNLKKNPSKVLSAKKAVSYQVNPLYSLVPVQYNDTLQTQFQFQPQMRLEESFQEEDQSEDNFERTQDCYEPISTQNESPDKQDNFDYEPAQTESISLDFRTQPKELKVRPHQQQAQAHMNPRQLNFTATQSTANESSNMEYLAIRQLRSQLTQAEELLSIKDRQIESLSEQVKLVSGQREELRCIEEAQREGLMAKDAVIQSLQAQVEELLQQHEMTSQQWHQERAQILQVQEQVSRVCQDQLQNFYDLNKKSEQVIQRLESEVCKYKQEVDRANCVIEQQHEMYFRLYHQGANGGGEGFEDSMQKNKPFRSHTSLSLNQQFQQCPSQPSDQSMTQQTPVKRQSSRKKSRAGNSLEREKLFIQQRFGLPKKAMKENSSLLAQQQPAQKVNSRNRSLVGYHTTNKSRQQQQSQLYSQSFLTQLQ